MSDPAATVAATTPATGPPRCAFFLKHKNRKCTVLAKPGSNFCVVHEPQEDTGSDDFRLPCPFGKHTVRRADMERHLRLCPDGLRRPELHFAYARDVNKRPHTANYDGELMDPETTAATVQRVVLPSPPPHFFAPPPDAADSAAVKQLVDYISLGKLGGDKHSAQRLGLVRIIDQMVNSLPAGEPFGFVEFGAGKAGLSLALKVAYPDATLLVVDRDRFRDCMDKVIRSEEQAGRGELQRVKIDVADFDFNKYTQHCASLPESECRFRHVRHWFAVGKHLCGGCTDMSLRSVEQARPLFRGVAIATCCHHRCSADTLFGDFENLLPRDGGDTPGETTGPRMLHSLAKIASWATSGETADEKKIATGARVKLVIDMARLERLRQLYPNATAVRYIAADISPENLALVGWDVEPAA